MFLSIRQLTTISFTMLAGIFTLPLLMAAAQRASAEPFQPIKEAEMPRGFPTYTPVGQIEIKKYPAYRKASASGFAQFWTLFRHIKEKKIEMSAPVEMDYGNPAVKQSAERSMSFLYGEPTLGYTGKQGTVEVSDVPAMTVASIGCRGNQTAAAIAAARQKLLDYLADKKVQLTIAGSMRVMGYNSPFVPRDKNFFEVQIPLKPVGAGQRILRGRQMPRISETGLGHPTNTASMDGVCERIRFSGKHFPLQGDTIVKSAYWLAMILVIIGAVNWGLVGLSSST